MIDLNDKVKDPELKAQYLTKFKHVLHKKDNKLKIPETQVSLNKILNMFKKAHKPVSLQGLQTKLQQVRHEIRELKA